MLEQIFSSKTRVKLLTLFLQHPDKAFYVRELTRRLNERINSIRRELSNLESIGLLTSKENDRKLYYQVDKNFYCFTELQRLFAKANIGPQDRIIRELKQIPGLQFGLLSGFFTNRKFINTDILLVGTMDKKHINGTISDFERELDRELNYTVMSVDEFQFRKEMHDAFIDQLLSGDHMVIIDLLAKRSSTGLLNIKKLHPLKN